MAVLAPQSVSPTGLEATYSACAGGGDKVKPGPTTFLHIKNGSGGDITVSVDDPNSKTPPGAAAFNPDLSVVVTAGEDRFIGPITDRFVQSDGYCNITYSGVTSLTAAHLVI